MKKRTIATTKAKSLKIIDFTKNILPQKDKNKIKGGANPWLE